LLYFISSNLYATTGVTCDSAYAISNLPFSLLNQTTAGAGDDYDSSQLSCATRALDGEEFVFTYTPFLSQFVDISLTGTLPITGIFVLDGCPDDSTTNCIAAVEEINGNPNLTSVLLTGGTQYYIIVGSQFQSTPFSINIQTGAAPVGIDCDFPDPIASLPYAGTGFNTAGSGSDYSSADACNSRFLDGEDYVFEYTPSSDQTDSIALSGTVGNSIGLFVFDGCPDDPATNCIAADSTFSGDPKISEVCLRANTTYYIIVSSYNINITTPFDLTMGTLPPSSLDADFMADVTDICAGETVNFTDLSTGCAASWLWTFGDGGSSTVQNPSHTFNTPGTYTVSMFFGFSSLETKSAYIRVAANPSSGETCANPHAIASTPFNSTGFNTRCAGNDYSPTDSCASPYLSGNDYVFSYTPANKEMLHINVANTDSSVGVFLLNGCPDDPNTSCLEEDGQLTGNPAIDTAIVQAGTQYYIIVSTFPFPGANDTLYESTIFDLDITSTPCPYANFTADTTTIIEGDSIQFMDLSIGCDNAVSSWAWTFGDGSTSSDQNPTHTYSTPGTYSVTLLIGDGSGIHVTQQISYITVLPDVPVPGGTCASAEVIPLLPWSATNQTTDGAGDNYEPSDACNSIFMGGNDYVYQYVPTEYEVDSLTLISSSGDATVFVLDGCPDDPATECLGSATVDQDTAILTGICISAGLTHYIVVSSTSANQFIDFDLYIENAAVEELNISASDSSVCAGDSITFRALNATCGSDIFWDFGDGSISTDTLPTHVYTSGGTYDVTLIFSGDTVMKSQFITVSSSDSATVCANAEVIPSLPFSRMNGNTECSGDDYTSGDGCSSIYMDGNEYVFEYTPTQPEKLSLTLSNTDALTGVIVLTDCPDSPGAQCKGADGVASAGDSVTLDVCLGADTTYYILVSSPPNGSNLSYEFDLYIEADTFPVADFIVDTTTVMAGDTAHFTDLSSICGMINNWSWSWDFGDGGTSTLVNPTHVYSAIGTYTVTLTVSNGIQSATRTDSALIEVIGFGNVGANCSNPYIIDSLPFFDIDFTTQQFDNDYSSADACQSIFMDGEDIIFEYTADTDQAIDIQVLNASEWSGLYFLSGCPDDPNTTCIASMTNYPDSLQLELFGNEVYEDSTYYIVVSTNQSLMPFTTFDLLIEPSCGRDVFEPNNTLDSAAVLPSIGVNHNAQICTQGDNDWYSFVVDSDNNILVQLSGFNDINLDLQVYTTNSNVQVGSSLEESDSSEFVILNFLTVGATYNIRVFGGNTGAYGNHPYNLYLQRRDVPFSSVTKDHNGINAHQYQTAIPIDKLDDSPMMLSAYPNPFDDKTTIEYYLPTETNVSMTVFDMLGKKVMIPLKDKIQSQGKHTLSIERGELKAGIYNCILESPTQKVVYKLVIQ